MGKKYKYRKEFTFEGKRYSVKADTQSELYMKMANKLRDLEENPHRVHTNMTVRAWAELAISTYKTNQKDITRDTYVEKMNRIVLSEIGNLRLRDVRPIQCQNIVNGQIGKSKRTIDETAQILKFIFRTAVQNNLIASNPAENIVKPSGDSEPRRAITAREREHFLLVCDREPAYTLFLLMLYCGCRPSEAIEAEGRDIRLIDGEHVLHIRGTKTVNADRFVPIPDDFYPRIAKTPKFSPISPNKSGRKHSASSYARLRKHLYRDMNISMGCKVYRNKLIPPFPLADDFVPYDLRHTYCTDLCKRGVDIRTAQYLMGHSDISLTANIYTHIDMEHVRNAAALINGKVSAPVSAVKCI